MSAKNDKRLREREVRLKENEKFQRRQLAQRKLEENELQLMALNKLLPDFLTLRQIAILQGHIPTAYENVIEKTDLEIEERKVLDQGCRTGFYLERGATKTCFKRFLQNHGQWPANGLLANWWPDQQSEAKTLIIPELPRSLVKMTELSATKQFLELAKFAQSPFFQSTINTYEMLEANLPKVTFSKTGALPTETRPAMPKPANEKPSSAAKNRHKTRKRENQLHTLIWRIYNFLSKGNGRTSAEAKSVWDEIRFRHAMHDIDHIIMRTSAEEIHWRSRYYNDQSLQRNSFDALLSRLIRNPPE